jgi:hypothetical protein
LVNIPDEIKKLKNLLDDGAITQEEFDAMKKDLLNNGKEHGDFDSNKTPTTQSERTSPKAKKTSPKGCFTGCLTLIIIVVILSVIVTVISEGENESNKVVSTKDPKLAYEEELKPSIDEITKEFDITHSDYWSKTLLNLSEGKLSATDAYKNLKSGEKRYSQLDRMTAELKGDFLSKKQKDLLREYKNAYQITIIKRQQAHQKMADAVNNNNLKPSVETDIQKLMEESDVAMMQAILKLTELETSLGVKR